MLSVIPYSEFTFLKKLGEGTYGKVYSAKNSRGGMYAVKIFKIKHLFEGKPNLTEMETMDFLTKKYRGYFPKVYGYILEESKVGIVYELYTSNLEKLSNNLKEDMSFSRIYKWMFLLLENLHILHSEKIYHRDIKPTNILWDSSTDKVTFCDFGSSRRFCEQNNMDGYTGIEAVTTKGYIAPEFLEKDLCNYDPNYMHGLDIWSLGITFLTFITKKVVKDYTIVNFLDIPHSGVKKVLKRCLTADYLKRPTAGYLLSKYFSFPIKETSPVKLLSKFPDEYNLSPIAKRLEMREVAIDLAIKIHDKLEEKEDFLNKLSACHISQCYFEAPPYSLLAVAEMYAYSVSELENRCRKILKELGFGIFYSPL